MLNASSRSNAAGAGGVVANSVIDGTIPTGTDIVIGGVANVVGAAVGGAVSPVANALASSTVPAVKGLATQSLSGRVFYVGGQQAVSYTSEAGSSIMQDLAGEATAAAISEVASCVQPTNCQ